ncbi:MAG: type II secretion system minor pseudopilin GspI [Chitinivorax sp.]|jgi:general secretion pathway protein I
MCRRRTDGFTLVEVLVALAILAVALAAAMRATGSLIDNTTTLKEHLAAGWVAQNLLQQHIARQDFPELGSQSGSDEMAGIPFLWREDVSGTPNNRFRRIEISVFANNQTDYASARLIGYLSNAR